jgi:hypothetical protein
MEDDNEQNKLLAGQSSKQVINLTRDKSNTKEEDNTYDNNDDIASDGNGESKLKKYKWFIIGAIILIVVLTLVLSLSLTLPNRDDDDDGETPWVGPSNPLGPTPIPPV